MWLRAPWKRNKIRNQFIDKSIPWFASLTLKKRKYLIMYYLVPSKSVLYSLKRTSLHIIMSFKEPLQKR